jgi:tetratricopeptide (TPR) repeat protein
MRFLCGLSLVLLVVRTAAADSRAAEAKHHFEAATSHYAVGEFAEAAEEYERAFKLKNDPALLYNAAQARRLSNQPDKALILYRNYVQLYPNEPNIEETKAQITKLREAIAAAEKAKNAPPTEPVTPKPIVTQDEPKPVVVAPTPAPAPRPTPVYKRWWLWTIVGVVVAGAVVGTAVGVTTSSGSWANGPTVGPGRSAITVQW